MASKKYYSDEDLTIAIKALELTSPTDTFWYATRGIHLMNVTGTFNWWHRSLKADKAILNFVENVDWTECHENFVHIASGLYDRTFNMVSKANQTDVDDDQKDTTTNLGIKLRESKFGKMAAIAYALLMDVYPNRRDNLQSRLEFWSNTQPDYKAASMLEALFIEWSGDKDFANKYQGYGMMVQALDPMSSRNASMLLELLNQYEHRHEQYSQLNNTIELPAMDSIFD